ncbi:quinone oxidoreductase [Pseudomonas aeruginosa]|nr:quinone oxidoreductase [Pseudomonas aeruginosa]
MAKRIQFAAYGGPEVLEYRDYQPAEPAPGKSACVIAPSA